MRLMLNQRYSRKFELLILGKRSTFGFWAGHEFVSELVRRQLFLQKFHDQNKPPIWLVSLGPLSKGNVLLLTTNTEVSIAPKLHRSQGPTPSTPSKFATKTTDSSLQQDTSITEDAIRRNAQLLRVIPQRILRSACSEYNGPELTAYVSPATYSQLKPSHGGFNKNTATVLCFEATLKRLPPPVDPSLTTLPTSHAPAPIPRILKPEAADKADHVDAQKQDDPLRSVFVGWAEGIPENHVVFPALPDSAEEWDIVQ